MKADVEWLTKVVTSEDDDDLPVEWSGYMNSLAREKDLCTKHQVQYIYSPPIDAPPRHSSNQHIIHIRVYEGAWPKIYTSGGRPSTVQNSHTDQVV